MIIKVTLICLAFVPLVIGSVSGNPTDESARVGKFLGWLAGKKKRFCDRIRSEIPSR